MVLNCYLKILLNMCLNMNIIIIYIYLLLIAVFSDAKQSILTGESSGFKLEEHRKKYYINFY